MRQLTPFIFGLFVLFGSLGKAQESADSLFVDSATTPHYIGIDLSPISRVLFNTSDIRISAIYRKQLSENGRLRIGLTQFGAVGGEINQGLEFNDTIAILNEPNFYRAYATVGREWVFPSGNFNLLLSADLNLGYGNQEVLSSYYNRDSLNFTVSRPPGFYRKTNLIDGEFAEYSKSHSFLVGAAITASLEMNLTNTFSLVLAMPVEFTFLSTLSEERYTDTYNASDNSMVRTNDTKYRPGKTLSELTMLPARIYLFYHF